jgi:transposase InsO family protein
MLHLQDGYPIRAVCQLLNLPRSTFYHRPSRIEGQELEAQVIQVLGEFPTYGTRRVTWQLRRPPYQRIVNRKRIQRLMRRKGLLRAVRKGKKGTTNSQHAYRRYPNRVKHLHVSLPDQVWVADITYIRLQREYVYLAILLDVFTRAVRGWCLSRFLDQSLTLSALRQALQTRRPQIHHSDQGIQYAANDYTDLLHERQVAISMASVGKAEENGYAERFMRTVKEEEVDLSEYRDFNDARQQIGDFIEKVYNHKRIHSALGYLTPVEFERDWFLAQTQAATVPLSMA